jgi:hypothetical protein
MDAERNEQRPPTPLDDLLAQVLRRVRLDDNASLQTMSAPAFRAIVAQRLESLERDLAEVRTRVNGLLFVVVGAVASQVLLRLLS